MTQKEKIDWRLIAIGIICLTGYGVYAMSQGIDGKLMSCIIAIIAFAIGITIPLDKLIKH